MGRKCVLWVCGQPHIPVVVGAVGDGEEMCVVGLWSTTHTSGGGGWATTAAAGLFTCRGSLPATPLRSQIIVTLLKSHCVPW